MDLGKLKFGSTCRGCRLLGSFQLLRLKSKQEMKNYIIVDYASNLADKTLTTFISSDKLFKHMLMLFIPPWPVGHKLKNGQQLFCHLVKSQVSAFHASLSLI